MQGIWSFIGKIGTGAAQNFPYEIGDKVGNLESKSVWTLHQGKKKGTGESVSVFVHDVKSSSEEKVQTAKSALRRLKTLRHPNILRFIDGLESETVIYMVTEPVVPLEEHLNEEENSKSDLAISWGIHQITAGLSFLVNDCSLIHGNVCKASVFVDVAGEWKLSGVEYIKPVDPPPNTEEPDLPRLPMLQVYEPPEGRKFSKTNKKIEKWSADMWGLGCLIWEVFNGSLSRTASLKSVGKIPKNLLSDYVQLVGANPKSRPNPAKFLQECRADGHYLKNSFVDANLFLQELQIKEQKEQKVFFTSLSSSLDSFPQQFCKHKILPQLLNAYEYGSAGSAVLGPLFKVGKLLEADEYEQKIVPCVVKLFSSTDRATRIHLLQQLDNFIHHLKPSIVDEQIFPHVAMGFGDTVPAMREQTVKSMLLLAGKLSEKTVNNQLLKYFAKLQMDQEAGIRTNTTVCLGKIAVNLSPATRQKVLIPAFLRALRDPFPPARTAGVMGFFASADFFNLKECASRILPALCALTLDPERKVRDQVFKVIKMFLSKVENASEDPESVVNQTGVEQTTASTAGGSSWTGWAVSSLTSKLYRGNTGTTAAAAAPTASSEPDKNPEQEKSPVSSVGGKTTDAASTEPKATKQTTEREKDEDSGSDYGGDEWGADEWTGDDWNDAQEPDVGELKRDLLAAKEELETFQSVNKATSPRRPAGLSAEGYGEGSGSDYGDWENDDWSSDSFAKPVSMTTTSQNRPPRNKPVQQARGSSKTKQKMAASPKNEDALVADLLGGVSDQPAAGSGWEDDDLFTPQVTAGKTTINESTSARNAQSKKKLGSDTSPAIRDTTGDMWDAGDWGTFDESPLTKSTPPSTTKTPDDGWGQDEWGAEDWGEDKLSKAELAKKKREERRLKQQAQKEKRSAGGRGPLKLGAVKMQSE